MTKNSAWRCALKIRSETNISDFHPYVRRRTSRLFRMEVPLGSTYSSITAKNLGGRRRRESICELEETGNLYLE